MMIWRLIENIMLYYHPRRKYYNHDKLIDRENKLCSTKFLHNDREIKCILITQSHTMPHYVAANFS